MSCPSRTNSSSRWTQLSPSFKTESLSQNETPPAGTSSETRRKPRYKNRSWTTRPWARQSPSKAKQELKNIRQQIADEKSSAQPCNCDYDQLLNNIVHEQVDVNRHRLLSTANDVSRYCDFNPPAHHNRTADRSRFGSSKPLLEHQADDNSKPTCCHRITAHVCARNCG